MYYVYCTDLRFGVEEKEGRFLAVVDVLLDASHLPFILQEHARQVAQFSNE